jgi:RpiR family carbohydrate utilization transcriptional regulator
VDARGPPASLLPGRRSSIQPAPRTTRPGSVLIAIRGVIPSLNKAEKRVARAVASDPEAVLSGTVTTLGKAAQVSEATVVRFCRTMGYSGFAELKIALARDLVPEIKRIHEDVTESDDPALVIRKVFDASVAALEDTLRVLDPAEIRAAADALKRARKILIVGVGTSAPGVMDAYNKLMRLGLNVTFSSDAHLQMMEAALLTDQDVIVAITHSGSTKDPVDTVRVAAERGALAICITNNALSPITKYCPIKLVTAARETRFRTEALSSRISQAAITDALYTLVALSDPAGTLARLAAIEDVIVSKQY